MTNRSSMTDIGCLHIQVGDSSAGALRESGIPGDILVWHDPVMEGPLVPRSDSDQYRRLRAGHFVDQQYVRTLPEAIEGLSTRHDTARRAAAYPEVVLWFDACLFDQSNMIHIIDFLSRLDTGPSALSLICIGEHDEVPGFRGLGELTPLQMAKLFPGRRPLTPEQIDLAQTAWQVFAADSPLALRSLAAAPCDALPYLQEALTRRLEQFPSLEDGLNRMEHEALRCVADGASGLGELFNAVSACERRPFFGDSWLWSCVADLAGGQAPLVSIEGPGPLKRPLWDPIENLSRWTVAPTDAGRRVLAGEVDWLTSRPLDKWLGGVRLVGSRPRWRWSRAARALIEDKGK